MIYVQNTAPCPLLYSVYRVYRVVTHCTVYSTPCTVLPLLVSRGLGRTPETLDRPSSSDQGAAYRPLRSDHIQCEVGVMTVSHAIQTESQ